ncbi:hypothetical protein EVAR_44717_1 [Eumeta japonica]|uniref:Uncharacterized protein n=1 Tax=Eumeta variegata TaxID=151549 RepID=A0A4C1XIQ7_EUMVA|nr:hypothetical protein EVAR_44717_1 [Eumeta japonica]
MIHLLSYVGVSHSGEVCLWTILGLLRCIFDATSFKFNTNLKQAWYVSMPPPLAPPVARVLRAVICGVVFVQCLTVYAYLASYIILLYPVFLEERSTLVLPWLLLTAVRQLLCELLSLSTGLAACVFLGAARAPCIKFVVFKIIFFGPWLYVWMLLFDYYKVLKVVKIFKNIPTKVPAADPDHAIELAVRRRRTKSLLEEERLRRIITATLVREIPAPTQIQNAPGEGQPPSPATRIRPRIRYGDDQESTIKIGECLHRNKHIIDKHSSGLNETNHITTSVQEQERADQQPDIADAAPTLVDAETCDDWLCNDVTIPRGSDRVLEQFSLMMLRLATFIQREGTDPRRMFNYSESDVTQQNPICDTNVEENEETPPQVGSKGSTTAAYLRDYPNIFRTRRADPT